MIVSLRRLAALGLVGALGLAAAPVKKIQFTDTKLKNGLRVIISEDHSAPVFAVAVNYNVGSRDERKGRTGFAHLFEHMMFKGSANVGAGRAPAPRLRQRRLDERHDQQGSDALLRDPAGQPARPRAVPRGRPHALARHHRRQPREPAQRRAGRAPPRRRQPAVRPDVRGPRRAGVRQLRLQALGHRLDGRSERRDGRRRLLVLQDLLRAQQRRPQHRRRRRHEGRRSRRSGSTSSRFPRSRRRRRSTSPSRRRRKSGARPSRTDSRA